jgi:23S rRNA (guanosine2251-2'-O)-methyltransferase
MRHQKWPPHRTTPSAAARQQRQGNVLCGINAIQEALRMGTRRLERIWFAEGKQGKRFDQVRALAAMREITIETVPSLRLTEAAGTTAHQGIVAFVASTSEVTFEQLTARFTAQRPIPNLALLDGVKDPRNLGALIRTAAAFGIGGVIVPGRRAVGITATVAKAAAGGLEHVAVVEVTNISQTLDRLKQLGFWIIGTDEQAPLSCQTFTFPTPLALVFGDEGSGISPLVKRRCDALVSIPVRGPLRSLNVAVAAAVLFYEVMGREVRCQTATTAKSWPESSSL